MREGFQKWIEGSHFVNDDGVPSVFFHGTDVENPFNIFAYCDEASLGFHFGTAAAASDRLVQTACSGDEVCGLIIPVHCRAQRPLVLDDLFTWSQWETVGALVDAGVITEDETDYVVESMSGEMIYAAVEEAGYDCVLYTNTCEAKDDGEHSLMIWRASLVKGIHSATFDPSDPRIMSQLAVSDDEAIWYEEREREIDACRSQLRSLRAGALVPA